MACSSLSWVTGPALISLILVLLVCCGNADESVEVKLALIGFLQQISGNNITLVGELRWNASTNPCNGWSRVACRDKTESIQAITLDGLNLQGTMDLGRLCQAPSLEALRLQNNKIQGILPPEISNCSNLTHLYLGNNSLSGRLPSSLATLGNLKVLSIYNNNFSGELPELSKISGLSAFLAQNNALSGSIPPFWFKNFGAKYFNVSHNLFTGAIPRGGDKFDLTSFLGNPGLCGMPLSEACPPTTSGEDNNSPSLPREKVVMASGYIALGLVLLIFITCKLISKRKKKKRNKVVDEANALESSRKSSVTMYKTGTSRSEYSITPSTESAATASSPLIVLNRPGTSELKFEDLLKAPAELLGRGRFGSTYKVVMGGGVALAVKRIKDSGVSKGEFQRRMERVDKARHRNVLPVVAFYCSVQEKLVVYEYQQNGSLSNFLHGNQAGGEFDWSSRIRVAAAIAEGLAFMHKQLQADGIGHGNLKSSNILMNTNMDPCITEYGLIATATATAGKPASHIPCAADKADVYGFGIVLLELLTGKLVQNDPFELARWVNSVVREEWTGEVFDKSLVSDGLSEERMVKTLQVGLKCINPVPDERPGMELVAASMNAIREEDERSLLVSEAQD